MIKKLNWKESIHRIEASSYIACIGAGRNLKEMQERFKDSIVLSKIQYIADNDINKQNMKILIDNRKIQILGVENLLSVLDKNAIIIITCTHYQDILEQLQQYDIYENVDIYVYTYLWRVYYADIALKKEIPLKLRLSDKPIIPKTIHYCWFGGKPLPDKYKRWMESWHKYCPDYKIIEWNESNYDIAKNSFMKQAYESKKWAFVSDYARVDVVCEQGGIYLDTDVELLQGLDDLLYQRGFAGFECSQYVNFGGGFGAVAGNRIMQGIRHLYDELYFDTGTCQMQMIASPIIQTNYLLNYGLQLNGEYQILNNEITIYPEKMFFGKSFISKQTHLKPYTRAIHHYDGSWLDEKAWNWHNELEKEMNSNI